MDKENNAPILDELPIPEAKAPEKTEYETDILVIGGGWAGITAAAHAKELGGNVMLVDKGTPGSCRGCKPTNGRIRNSRMKKISFPRCPL